jgi:O-antigen ligase
MYLLFGVAYFLAHARHESSKISFVVAAAITAVIALSGSRMALLTACALLPLSSLSIGRKHFFRTNLESLTLFVLASASVFYLVTRTSLEDRFFQGDTSMRLGGFAINASGRTETWRFVWESSMDSPWWGHGAGSTQEFVTARYPDMVHAHNDYLRILHDYGVIGGVLWAAAYILLFIRIAKAWVVADRGKTGAASFHLFALLALVSVAALMATDNALVYAFVMSPAAMIAGAALAVAREQTEQVRLKSAGYRVAIRPEFRRGTVVVLR